MGQGQSSDSQTAQNDGEKKTDYYELLEVDRQATDEELKRAYRRKALELHPDRNYGNVEETTQRFAAIQSAYEVLSDPQERAWYDSHREVFLGGGQQEEQADSRFFYNIQMTTTDNVLKLMIKYNGRMEYSDSASGFFGGLREFFSQLAKEEEAAAQWEKTDPIDYPNFGHKEDDYDDVVRPFYASWAGFASKKSFSWKDKYRLSDAEDRQVRRLMEKENKGMRDEAAREFNDAVRSLVAFVRKRDPRYQGNQKSEAERQKILRNAAAAQSARSRAARQAKLQELNSQAVPDWAKPAAVVENEGDFSSEDEAEVLEIECVVCNKVFKSEAQYQAHEKSKKHLKLLKQLKREMRDEDHEVVQKGVQSVHTNEQNNELHGNELHDNELHDDEINSQKDDEVDEEPDEVFVEDSTTKVLDEVSYTVEEGSTKDEEDSDYAARSDIEDRLADEPAGRKMDIATAKLGAATLEQTPQTSDTEPSISLKPGKAKQKRAKKAAKEKMEGKVADQESKCAVCQASFPSKTKLFNHIKEKGHAAPVLSLGKGVRKGKNR